MAGKWPSVARRRLFESRGDRKASGLGVKCLAGHSGAKNGWLAKSEALRFEDAGPVAVLQVARDSGRVRLLELHHAVAVSAVAPDAVHDQGLELRECLDQNSPPSPYGMDPQTRTWQSSAAWRRTWDGIATCKPGNVPQQVPSGSSGRRELAGRCSSLSIGRWTRTSAFSAQIRGRLHPAARYECQQALVGFPPGKEVVVAWMAVALLSGEGFGRE